MAERKVDLYGAAWHVFHDRTGEVLISGPAGTGKSLGCLYKILRIANDYPGSRQLILRQTHSSLTASTLVTFEQQVAPEALASGTLKWFGGSGRKPAAYEHRNGSSILVGGLDQPGKLLSTEYDLVFIDEANQVSLTAYETLLTRLRGKRGPYRQIILACNPDHPDHWLKKRAEAGALKMLDSRHADNPHFVNDDGSRTDAGHEYLARLDALTGVRKLRYRDGIWAAAEGMVYEDWREADNLIDWFPVPKDWPLFLTVDFGYNDAFVCQWWRTDPDGRMYLTREIHRSQVLVEDHARHIRDIMEENEDVEPTPYAVVCDHQLEDRKTLERHLRMPTIPAKKGISRGIQLTQSRIRKQGDGRPRMYVFRNAVVGRDDGAVARNTPRGWAAELTGYVWQTVRGTDGIPKEVPVDKNNHSLDAGRYAVAHLDWNEVSRLGNPAAQPTSVPAPNGSPWSSPVGR